MDTYREWGRTLEEESTGLAERSQEIVRKKDDSRPSYRYGKTSEGCIWEEIQILPHRLHFRCL